MYIGDNFSNVEKYKLFRNMYEVIHPSISKKNISNYRIVLDENILPIRVYYPKKLADINSCIIFIPSDGHITGCFGNYDNIFNELAIKTEKLIIAIDYFDEEFKYPYLFDKCYESVNFIFNELLKNKFEFNSIFLAGDSFGGNLVSSISLRRKYNNINTSYKQILFYPILSGQYFGNAKFESLNNLDDVSKKQLDIMAKYFKKYISNKKRLNEKYVCPIKEKEFSNYPKTLIFTGDSDVLRDENQFFYEKLLIYNKAEYKNIVFAKHGFLKFDDNEIRREVFLKLYDFMSND